MSKRSARDIELEYVVEEILEVVNARDENNVPLHQEIMAEPVAFVLFNTPHALLDVLKNKPLRVLALIRTNKALNKVWRNIPGIWPVLLDNLLALEEADDDDDDEEEGQSGHMSKIYPFFIVAQHRVEEESARPVYALHPSSRNRPNSNPMVADDGGQALLPKFRRPVQVLGRTYSGARYSLIYYDAVTQHFIDLLQKLSLFNQAFGLGGPASYTLMIAQYLGIVLEGAHTTRYELKLPDYVVVLRDSFLVSNNTEITYRPAVIRDSLKKIIAWLEKLSLSEIDPNSSRFMIININQVEAPAHVIKEIREAKTDALRLQRLLTTELIMQSNDAPPPKRIHLDEDVARPYRAILFNRENGLYKTPESQQKLFVDVLSALYLNRYVGDDDDIPSGRSEFIRRYGNLHCSVCGKESEHVDSVLLQAFCNDACRASDREGAS